MKQYQSHATEIQTTDIEESPDNHDGSVHEIDID